MDSVQLWTLSLFLLVLVGCSQTELAAVQPIVKNHPLYALEYVDSVTYDIVSNVGDSSSRETIQISVLDTRDGFTLTFGRRQPDYLRYTLVVDEQYSCVSLTITDTDGNSFDQDCTSQLLFPSSAISTLRVDTYVAGDVQYSSSKTSPVPESIIKQTDISRFTWQLLSFERKKN